MTANAQLDCPRPDELERSYWSGDGACDAHRAICSTCSASWREIEELAALGETLEGPEVSGDRREQVRTMILSASASAASARPSRRRLAAGGAALAIAAGALLVLGLGRGEDRALAIEVDLALEPVNATNDGAPAPAAPIHRGTVAALGAVSFAIASAQPDEVVRFHQGVIDVDVDDLRAGERFRVITGDAEIEVRGTAFRVTAEAGALVSVVVTEGVVEVRSAGAERSLSAGQRWDRAVSVTRRARSERIEQAIRPDAAVAPRAPTAYERGWSHLREKRYTDAAGAFETAIDSETGASRADALYWASISHFRAGKRTRAGALLHRFLENHATDRRRPEVAVMLGWIEVDRDNFEAARRLFTIGASARSKKVRESARAGLDALRTRTPR